MAEPHLRAADSDRAAVASTLGRAMSEGRLTVAEYDDRLARAYAARTFGELAELTADLPAAPPRPAPVRSGHPAPVCGGRGYGRLQQVHWGSWASTAVIVLMVWAVSSLASRELLYFWPFWVIVPWGAVLLLGRIAGGGRGTRPGGGRDRQAVDGR
ncbi:DUF1707 domain-containing protein [Blastococcus sp. MG754426]|uniref:DUF1707 SHOCT-like domain-containing protein n=1 Tax=unclassified Blastococcus TaxID=2619396 RepID=UPI001EF013B0|nr:MULTISPECIES: DUF1707 domain-containing protein [unclassified Blastococcus]MCF6509686.1 DUF1707 domain-containing protein [Blastococcus sp. MG754426]MCF6512228.1 DUF1707 domain-containing protein [Blastococcus sp. MG754427]